MTESYSIEIPNDKAGTYRVISLIIAMINFFAFAYAVFAWPGSFSQNWLLFLGMMIALACLAGFIFVFVRKKGWPFPLEWFLVISALLWVISGATLPGIALLVFSGLSYFTNQQKFIHFREAGVTYPALPVKTYLWSDLEFVLLKDEILSIETKQNHVMQFTLQPSVAALVDESAFNHFCERCILASK